MLPRISQIMLSTTTTKTKFTPLDSNEAFRYLWYSWRMLGLDPPWSNGCYYWLYQFFSVAWNTITTACFPISLLMNVLFIDNLEELLVNLSMSITVFINSLKLLTIYSCRHTLKNVRSYLTSLDERCAPHASDRSHVKNAIRVSRIFYCTYQVYLIFIAFGYSYIGLANRRLVFNGWWPRLLADADNNLLLGIWYQAISVTMVALQNTTNDTYPLCYLAIMNAHMRALRARIERIGEGGEQMGLEDTFQELLACIKDHNNVLGYFQLISKAISRTIAMQFLITALVLCVIVINVIAFNLSHMQLLVTVIYLLGVLFEVFPCCWYVTMLMDESYQMTTSLYKCLWYDQDQRFRKTLIIFMQRTQQTNLIVAGNMVPVTLDTFQTIIKFTFSLYTILSSMSFGNV